MGIIKKLDQLILRERSNMESVKWHTDIPTVTTQGMQIQGMADLLEKNDFELGWLLSYKEGSTIINARRPDGTKSGGKQRQLHCRARPITLNNSPALQWACHTEYSPIQHPQLHIDGTDLSWSDGQTKFYNVVNDVQAIDAVKRDKSWKPDAVMFE